MKTVSLATTLQEISFKGFSQTANFINHWLDLWRTNYGTLIKLTAVNTCLTIAMEFIARNISVQLGSSPEQSFLAFLPDGSWHIHQQSLINIFMTIFASLLAGPIVFFDRPLSRYIFFLCFGSFNSVLSQSFSMMVQAHPDVWLIKRFVFDLCFTGSVKFIAFELARRPILMARSSFMMLGGIRVTQDFCCTFIRVAMLNFLGFMG